MVQVVESERASARGHKLHTVAALPEGPPVALLCWHHGVAEHVGRYKEIFARLAEAGIAVYSGDVVGHGRSEGSRALMESYSEAVDEFLALCDHAVADVASRWPGAPAPPAFIAGHSLGGLIAGLACHRDQSRWAGLMMCSAALDVEMGLVMRIQAALGDLLSLIVPHARMVPAVRPEDMNPDPQRVQEYLSDPLNTIGNLPIRTGNEVLKGMKFLRRHWLDFTLPLCVHHGATDKCTSAPASEAFVAAASSDDKTFHMIPGGYHEVLFTPGLGPGLVDGMASWIKDHASGGGASAGKQAAAGAADEAAGGAAAAAKM